MKRSPKPGILCAEKVDIKFKYFEHKIDTNSRYTEDIISEGK